MSFVSQTFANFFKWRIMFCHMTAQIWFLVCCGSFLNTSKLRYDVKLSARSFAPAQHFFVLVLKAFVEVFWILPSYDVKLPARSFAVLRNTFLYLCLKHNYLMFSLFGNKAFIFFEELQPQQVAAAAILPYIASEWSHQVHVKNASRIKLAPWVRMNQNQLNQNQPPINMGPKIGPTNLTSQHGHHGPEWGPPSPVCGAQTDSNPPQRKAPAQP